jgi:hypothetical protein
MPMRPQLKVGGAVVVVAVVAQTALAIGVANPAGSAAAPNRADALSVRLSPQR